MAIDERSSPLGRFFRRIFASTDELEAEELQRDAVESGSTPVSGCRRGETVSVTGRLRTVVYTPRTTLPTLEAELYDGTGSITLIWLGRRRIGGIECGRSLVARGRMTTHDGRPTIYNAEYELKPSVA